MPVASANRTAELEDRMCYADMAAILENAKLGVSEAFIAARPAIEPVFRNLATRGYPADLQFSMLHLVAVFDGTKWHRNRADMPLLRGHNLESTVAVLRVTSRNLETESARLAETTATITRLEADLAEAKSQPLAAARRFLAERETWLQQKATLQAANTALKGELADTQSRLTSAVDRRAQRDSRRPPDQALQGSCAAAQRTGNRRTITVPATMSCNVRLCRLNRTSRRISEQVAQTVI